MKRSSLRRYTELRSSKPLRSSTALRRTGRIAGTAKAAQRRTEAARRAAYKLVDARAGGFCEMCGERSASFEHSHRSHAGIGGAPSTLRASNLLLSCAPFGCNWKLSADADFADMGRRLGWLIGRGADPLTSRVAIFGHGWVLLDDDGTYQQEGQ